MSYAFSSTTISVLCVNFSMVKSLDIQKPQIRMIQRSRKRFAHIQKTLVYTQNPNNVTRQEHINNNFTFTLVCKPNCRFVANDDNITIVSSLTHHQLMILYCVECIPRNINVIGWMNNIIYGGQRSQECLWHNIENVSRTDVKNIACV